MASIWTASEFILSTLTGAFWSASRGICILVDLCGYKNHFKSTKACWQGPEDFYTLPLSPRSHRSNLSWNLTIRALLSALTLFKSVRCRIDLKKYFLHYYERILVHLVWTRMRLGRLLYGFMDHGQWKIINGPWTVKDNQKPIGARTKTSVCIILKG